MGLGRKKAESDDAPGAPEWMVTFSDCMTLLLTFFVLLLSFSSFDDKVFRKLQVIFMKALPAVSNTDEKNKDAFLSSDQIEETPELAEGSEKPTLVRGYADNLQEETEPADFRHRRVFLISSKEIFWGKGTIISSEGRRVMTKMASFLENVPGRVVISENGPTSVDNSEQLGLPRAWAVMDYITTEHNLDKKRFSISAASAVAQGSPESSELAPSGSVSERTVEVILLDRSTYN